LDLRNDVDVAGGRLPEILDDNLHSQPAVRAAETPSAIYPEVGAGLRLADITSDGHSGLSRLSGDGGEERRSNSGKHGHNECGELPPGPLYLRARQPDNFLGGVGGSPLLTEIGLPGALGFVAMALVVIGGYGVILGRWLGSLTLVCGVLAWASSGANIHRLSVCEPYDAT
jgi:hypothetical protein